MRVLHTSGSGMRRNVFCLHSATDVCRDHRGLTECPVRRSVGFVMIRVPISALMLLAASVTALAEDCTFHTPTEIVIAKELMIIDLSVVNDARANGPSGPWSFGGLMQTMAPKPEDAGRFVKAWLHTWETNGQVNGFPLGARPDIAKVIIAPWMAR